MSPEAQEMLMGAIVPRLRSAIPRCVQPVGAEDAEELVQDGIAMAAKMVHNSEAAGKLAPAASIAYYTIQHLKSGRRSVGGSSADVMATGTQLAHNSGVLSLEEEVGHDEESGDPVCIGDLLASRADDPSMVCARNIDWEAFLASHAPQYAMVVQGIAQGQHKGEMAHTLGTTTAQLQWLTINLAADVLQFMGEQVLDESIQAPAWRAGLKVKSERVACQADRRRG